jgi:MFS family permease
MHSLVSKVFWFYPVRMISAISQVSFLPTLHAIASELAPKGKRGETVGRYLSMMGLSMMLGPFLGSFLIKYLDYRLMFLFAAVFPTFDLIAFMIARSYGLAGSTHNKKVVEKVKSRPKERKRFIKIIRSGSIAVTCFAGFLFAVSIGTFSTLFSVHAEEVLFFTPTTISLLFSVRGAANALIRFPAGRIADKVGRKKPLLLGICLMFTTFIILSLSQNFFILFITMGLYGLGWGMRAVSSITLIGESASLEHRGVAMALYLLMIDLGIAAGSIIAGAAASIFSTQTIFQITALIVLPSIPVVAIAKSIK